MPPVGTCIFSSMLLNHQPHDPSANGVPSTEPGSSEKRKKKKPKQQDVNDNRRNTRFRDDSDSRPFNSRQSFENRRNEHRSNEPRKNRSHQQNHASRPYSDQNETNPLFDRRYSHNPFVSKPFELKTGLLSLQRKERIDLKPKQVNVGSLKEGTVTSVSKYFIMILLDEDVETIDSISEKLKSYLMERRSKMNRPKPGFLGACFIDNRWLRAKIVGSFEMELVDVGKICTFCDKQGNSLHEIFFIDHWPEINQWTELSIKVSVESFTGGARKFLTSYQREQLEEKLVGKPFAIRFVAPSNSFSDSVELFSLKQIDGAGLVKHVPVTNIAEAPLNDTIVINHVGKSKDGVFYGQISGSHQVEAELSKMGGIYMDEKGLGINAVTMERGQYVVWRTKFKNIGRFRRVVVTGESDDGFYYEGRLVDTGLVTEMRISESFVMVKPFDKYPAQAVRFILSQKLAEPKTGKATSLKIYIGSRNDDGIPIVSRYDVLGREPASAKNLEPVELDRDEEEPASAKNLEPVELDRDEEEPASAEDLEPVEPARDEKEPESKESVTERDETVPVDEPRPASSASSWDCKLSTILEQQSVESFLAHEGDFSEDSFTSVDEQFEPSFYQVDGRWSYPEQCNGTMSDSEECNGKTSDPEEYNRTMGDPKEYNRTTTNPKERNRTMSDSKERNRTMSDPKECNRTMSDPKEQLEDFGDEIADLDLQRDVKLVLETILQKVESEVIESDEETNAPQSTEDTLVDLGLPQDVPEVLIDVGPAPGFAVDLMDLELDESPRSRINSNVDILTGNDRENYPDSTGPFNVGTSGDLIDC